MGPSPASAIDDSEYRTARAVGLLLAGLAAPPGIRLAPAQPPHTSRSGHASAATASAATSATCQTDDVGPLTPACPSPGSGPATYVYDEHIPKDAVNPSDQILGADGNPLSPTNSPCAGAAYQELAPQDNAPLLPGESLPSGDRNYRVQFTLSDPAGGPPGGQAPTVDVRVEFAGGENRDPRLAIARLEVAVVRLRGGARAARGGGAACFDLTTLKGGLRRRTPIGGRCGPNVWLALRGTRDATGVFRAAGRTGPLPLGR